MPIGVGRGRPPELTYRGEVRVVERRVARGCCIEENFWAPVWPEELVLSFERAGLPRPAILLFVFVITMQKDICTSFLDPEFSKVSDTVTPCLCWTVLSLRAYIAEKFVLLSAMLH